MGRQINFCMLPEDEKKFVRFVKSTGKISFIYPWSMNKKLVLRDELPYSLKNNWLFFIWNERFEFFPDFTEITKQNRERFRYVFKHLEKPLIELSRSSFQNKNLIRGGRIWAEASSSEFVKWYNQIARWIKKNYVNYGGVYISPEVEKWLKENDQHKLEIFMDVVDYSKLSKLGKK